MEQFGYFRRPTEGGWRMLAPHSVPDSPAVSPVPVAPAPVDGAAGPTDAAQAQGPVNGLPPLEPSTLEQELLLLKVGGAVDFGAFE